MQQVVVIGSAGLDIFAVSKHFHARMFDHRPQVTLDSGQSFWLDNAIQEVGGRGLTSAIAIARQDIPVHLFTKLGTDTFGKALQGVIKQEGIHSECVFETSKHHTDTSIHFMAEHQKQTVARYIGSFLSIDKREVAKLPKSPDWVHIADVPAEKSTLKALLRWLRISNSPTTLNIHDVHTLPARLLSQLLELCKILVISQDEACLLLGGYCSPEEIGQKLLLAGVEQVVIYDETEGEHVETAQDRIKTKKDKNTKVTESTGAEEVFAACYCAEYLVSGDIRKALTHATAQASSVNSVVGARAGILKKPVLHPIKITHYDKNKGEIV